LFEVMNQFVRAMLSRVLGESALIGAFGNFRKFVVVTAQSFDDIVAAFRQNQLRPLSTNFKKCVESLEAVTDDGSPTRGGFEETPRGTVSIPCHFIASDVKRCAGRRVESRVLARRNMLNAANV